MVRLASIAITLHMASCKVRAETRLWCAWLICPTLDEGMEGATILCHFYVVLLDSVAAFNVSKCHLGVALVEHAITSVCLTIIFSDACAKARFCGTTHVLLVLLVRINQRILDALHKHVADGLQCGLNVGIKFPTWF
jgi:hypothetical protein